MHDDDDYITIDTTTLDEPYYSTQGTYTVNMAPSDSTLTLTMPDEPVFTKTPDYESKKIKSDVGIDMIQEIKRSFGE